MNLRTLAERLARGKSFKRTIDVGGQKAAIILSPDAQLKYLKPGKNSFDQDLVKIARYCLGPTDNVWDIGANVGVFTIAAAVYAKSVVAVEADIWLANLLQRTANLQENSSLNIKIIPAAISNKNGVADFQIAARGRASNALASAGGRSQMGGTRETVCVPTLRLDTIFNEFGAPDFVKIDVEGAEWSVVSGGASLFLKSDPIIYIEIGSETRNDIFEFFKNAGYFGYNNLGRLIHGEDDISANVFFAREKQLPRLHNLIDHIK